jgi:hypothetical protein
MPYGRYEAIISNCHVRVAFAANKVETAKLISDMVGTMTVHKATRTYTGSRLRETHYLVRCQQWPRRLLLTRHHVHLMTRPSCSWRGILRSTPGRSGTTRIWSSEPDPSCWTERIRSPRARLVTLDFPRHSEGVAGRFRRGKAQTSLIPEDQPDGEETEVIVA